MRKSSRRVAKKTLTLDPKDLAELKKLLGVSSESEAVRRAIRERLAVERAVRAHIDLGNTAGIELVTLP